VRLGDSYQHKQRVRLYAAPPEDGKDEWWAGGYSNVIYRVTAGARHKPVVIVWRDASYTPHRRHLDLLRLFRSP